MPDDFEFGPFRLVGRLGLLTRDDISVDIGRRAAALLQKLVEEEGAPVSKDDLIAAAWPGLAVEESNLTVQVSALRRVLGAAGGAAWIETLSRRGYRYAGPPVSRRAEGAAAVPLPPSRPSVAVLPFADGGEEGGTAWFADGMVDDIITGLGRIRELFVVGRGTTFAYRDRPVRPEQAGRDLGVRYLLQGSIRRADGNVRITCQLVEAASGVHVWAERYDRRLNAMTDALTMSSPCRTRSPLPWSGHWSRGSETPRSNASGAGGPATSMPTSWC